MSNWSLVQRSPKHQASAGCYSAEICGFRLSLVPSARYARRRGELATAVGMADLRTSGNDRRHGPECGYSSIADQEKYRYVPQQPDHADAVSSHHGTIPFRGSAMNRIQNRSRRAERLKPRNGKPPNRNSRLSLDEENRIPLIRPLDTFTLPCSSLRAATGITVPTSRGSRC